MAGISGAGTAIHAWVVGEDRVATIVYSGNEVGVFHHRGESDYLLVTFSELHHERQGEYYYFGKHLAEKGDISCIGVINHVKGFYMSSEIENVVKIVDQIRGDRKVIVFGQSMGAFGAIKHSAALRADYVVACSSFYSMDPDELNLPSDRHRNILLHSMQHHGVVYRPEFTGMGLKPADCHGRIISLYDPFDSTDAYDADLIRKHLPTVEFVTVPLASHEIYNLSWTPKMFSLLMEAVQSDDRGAFAREMNEIRRATSQFMLRTIRKATYHKPEMCARVFRSPRVTRNVDYKIMLADPINLVLVYRLFAKGQRQLAASHFALVAKEVMQLDLDNAEVAEGPVIDAVIARKLCLLMSCHGSFLAYDLNTRSVHLDRNILTHPHLVPIHAKQADGGWVFYIRSESREIPVTLSSGDAGFTASELVPAGDNTVAIRGGGGVLSVNQVGLPHVVPQVLGEQERFVPLPIGEQQAAVKAGSINWFDQALLSQSAPAMTISNDIVATRAPRTGRWLKLFTRK